VSGQNRVPSNLTPAEDRHRKVTDQRLAADAQVLTLGREGARVGVLGLVERRRQDRARPVAVLIDELEARVAQVRRLRAPREVGEALDLPTSAPGKLRVAPEHVPQRLDDRAPSQAT